jgi:LPXTG-site transpeptidase (sortase) family protein
MAQPSRNYSYDPYWEINLPFRAKKARYYTSVAIMYIATLIVAFYVFKPFPSLMPGASAQIKNTPAVPAVREILVTSGLPNRIVIPSMAIDLPVDPGYYDANQNEWTLSGYHAQFAMPSTLANDYSGDTFIYGHNNRFVFGPLKNIAPGAEALVYTDNGHVFSYIFDSSKNLTPEDTSILNYKGPSMLTVQTCSGSFFEYRQLFSFKFNRLVQ